MDRVLSGIQPTGKIHIGNYIGAISQWIKNQSLYDNLFCIVDLHAITNMNIITPKNLREKTREVAAIYLACGIDPKQSKIFVQSDVSEHAELAWIFNCITPLGYLNRMTQFKIKSESYNVSAGLLTYPVLQAADILLYKTKFVPVGEDQRQHIELTREIARKFNLLYGDLFNIPQALISNDCDSKIMAIDNPKIKMSKSIGLIKPGHSIGLLDSDKEIERTIKSAVTDSGNEISFSCSGPGILNLLTIYRSITGETKENIENRFNGNGYGKLKKEITDSIISFLNPIKTKFNEINKEEDYLNGVLKDGANFAKIIANETLTDVKNLIGLGF